RKWCKSYIRTYLNNRPDTTAGERYQRNTLPDGDAGTSSGGSRARRCRRNTAQESATPYSSHQHGQLSPIYALPILNLVTKPHKTTQSKNIN
ncbi:hypothetical protein ACLD4S_23555, partial [Salmonella sp. 741265064_HSA]|uniref:hypothetical protein n=2 Tax=unclassified Salmonella TaxID=2614656 RepID=UPI00397F348C